MKTSFILSKMHSGRFGGGMLAGILLPAFAGQGAIADILSYSYEVFGDGCGKGNFFKNSLSRHFSFVFSCVLSPVVP